MQTESAVKYFSPRRKCFLLGALLEIFLIACYFLPESWLTVEIHNFTLVTHIPLLFLLESGLGSTAPTAILTLLLGFAAMAWSWGSLIFLVGKGIDLLLMRLNQKQRKFVWFGAGAVGLVCLAWAGISMLPETRRPFESSPEIKSVVDANNAFALELYQKLKDKPGNLFFSPYSISSLLAMTCAGARGQTELEMTTVLHFSLPPEKLHPASKKLMARLNGVQCWNRIILSCANSLWCQTNYAFTSNFLKTVHENYSAEARPVDFKNSSDAAAEEINRWIDRQTKHKIPRALEPGQLTPDTRLVLCDTMYFKGKWLNQFKTKNTQPAQFQVTTNESVTVPMMLQSAPFKHAITEDYSVELLELPYSGQDLSMVILLPRQSSLMSEAENDGLQELEQILTPENLRAWLKMLDEKDPHKTSVRFPRFTTTSRFDLTGELKSLGMTSAFSDAADFSGMDGTNNLFLSDVFHQAFVEVNETGTEAAAMTFAVAKSTGMDDRFIVDHPFIFLIRDNGSGSILFLGRILDPTR